MKKEPTPPPIEVKKEPTPPPVEVKKEPEPPKPAPINASLRRACMSYIGDWKIEGEELVQRASVQSSQLIFGDFTWKDYDFSAEVKVAGESATIHLLHRVTSGGQAYFSTSTWKPNSKVYAVALEAGRSAVSIHHPGGIRKDNWHQVRARVRGAQSQYFLDGRLVLVFEDSRNPQGAVGLAAYRTSAQFRNLQVTDPAGKVLFHGLPDIPALPDWSLGPAAPPSTEELYCLKGHCAPVVSVVFARNGRLLSSSDGSYLVWDETTKYRRVGGPGCTVRLWDLATGKELDHSPLASPASNNWPVTGLLASPQANTFASARHDLGQSDKGAIYKAQMWVIAGNKLQPRVLLPESLPGPMMLSFSPEGRRLLAMNTVGSVWEWDLFFPKLTRQVTGKLPGVSTLAMAPGGRGALLVRRDQPFAEFDLGTGKQTRRGKIPVGLSRSWPSRPTTARS